ncbi:MAG: flippase-like domain-containing protein [Candidatus Diapherotrites archaeon]|nr:flippase-like domain-containing protein [Candidatus Diapherotrites archaeon]
MTSKKWITLLQAILAVGLLAALIAFSGISKTIEYISKADAILVAASVASIAIANIAFAHRMKHILEQMGLRAGLKNVFLAHMAGMFAADLTPGKVGYFSVPYFLKKLNNIQMRDGLFATMITTIMDFVVKGVSVSFGLLIFISSFSETLDAYRLAILLVFPWVAAGALLLVISSSRVMRLLAKLPKLSALNDVNFKSRNKTALLMSATPQTLIIWLFSALSWITLAESLGFSLGLIEALIFPMMVSILFFVPVTIGGLGLAEGATAFLLTTTQGVPLPLATAFAVLWRGSMLVVDASGISTYLKLVRE